MNNTEEKKDSNIIKIIFIFMFIVIFVASFYNSHKSDVERQKEKEITEKKLFSLGGKTLESIKIYSDYNNGVLQIDDKDKVKDILRIIKQSDYGMPNHPNHTNSDSVNFDMYIDSNNIILTLYFIIMKEGINKQSVFLEVLNENSSLYQSSDLYSFLVKENIYDDKNRKFILK